MKKNVVFWIGVKSTNEQLIELKDYGDWSWMDYSKQTWEFWCKKQNVEFVHYDKTSNPDTLNHLVNWQRWFDLFNVLDSKNIDYDQILVVDASSMVHWNAPNFFDISKRKWCSFRANENLKWIIESYDGYQPLFPEVKFDYNDYIASGLAILNKSHKPVLDALKKYYDSHYDEIMYTQRTIKRGSDQPVINFMLRKMNVEINHLRLPYAANHIARRDMFSYNWQLQENTMPFFLKYLHIWFYSGLPDRGASRKNLMDQTWNIISKYYDENFILNQVKSKNQYVKTTTYKFKQDLLTYLSDNFKNKTVLELGCCHGDTTKVLAELFEKVIAVDISAENIDFAKANNNKDNIKYIKANVYTELIYPENVDVVIIDASHEAEQVYLDIKNISERYNSPVIILDDYGNGNDIKVAVDKAVSEGIIQISRYIGENAGYNVTRLNGDVITFTGAEGVICNLKN
jgi:2-polyprenyl-3-methyl-5-hydroxy-6-metoxy-1,4-benzoquinol methylase